MARKGEEQEDEQDLVPLEPPLRGRYPSIAPEESSNVPQHFKNDGNNHEQWDTTETCSKDLKPPLSVPSSHSKERDTEEGIATQDSQVPSTLDANQSGDTTITAPPAERLQSLTIFGHLSNKTVGNMEYGIHAWVADVATTSINTTESNASSTDATTPSQRCRPSSLLFLLSGFIIILQYFVLLFITMDAVGYGNACEEDSDCKEGQACLKFDNGQLYCAEYCNDNGQCIDAYDNGNNVTFRDQGHCPFLEQNIPSTASSIVVCLILIYVASSLLHDMDQNVQETRAAMYRLGEWNAPGGRQKCWKLVVIFVVKAIYYTRAYWLPGFTCAALIAILYAEDTNPSTIILNGLAIIMIGGTSFEL